ncbi:hypothetical protein [Cohnella sp. GbtcB17]|uniref:hypothetical protein n=1 Tax=Cohnella sp. GbtcB17 TaxID=2824762 RepID=UPI001C2F472B|nr:hypothetical protein [Cohnella sp. GbtcB17]
MAKRKDSAYGSRYAEIATAGYRKDQFGWIAHHAGHPAGIIEPAGPAAHKKAFYGVAKRS